MEWFCLTSELSAVVLSRVSQYNNGLVVTASYLDSDWQGLVKVIITNVSGRTVRLRFGHDIARLFLFRSINGSADKSGVREQGSHYGTAWATLLKDEGDPFPIGGQRGVRFREEALRNANQIAKDYVGPALITLLVGAVAAGWKVYSAAERAISTRDRVSAVERALTRAGASAPQSGITTIMVPAGRAVNTATVQLPPSTRVRPAGPFLQVQARSPQGARASGRIAGNGNRAALVLTARLDHKHRKAQHVDVQWLVIP